MLSDVMTLVVKTSELVVADVGAAVVVGGSVVVDVSLDTVVGAGLVVVVVGSALVVVVSVGVVATGTEVLVVVVSVSVADVVVSATEGELGLAVELGTVLDDVVAGAEDVDVASEEAAVAELVLMEVRLLLLDIVKDRASGCLDVILMKEGAMLAKTEDDNVICRETS